MKRHTLSRPARILCAAVPVCLLFTGCDPVDSQPGLPMRYKAPKLDTRRTGVSNPENARWIEAWDNLKEEMAPLQERLNELQQFHAANRFDSFLTLDPETLDKDQLCTLYHFLERGYFTVERRILLDLLNRRLQRTSDPVPGTEVNAKLKDLFAAAMHKDEVRMVDIETAVDYYTKAGTSEIPIPNSLSEVEHEELLTSVNHMLERTRSEIAQMDAKLDFLKVKAFPGVYPEKPAPPVETPAPVAVTESVSGPPVVNLVVPSVIPALSEPAVDPGENPDGATAAPPPAETVETPESEPADEPVESSDSMEPDLPQLFPSPP